MTKFKVGDIVTGINNHTYCITTSDSKCKIISFLNVDIENSDIDDIEVIIIDHKNKEKIGNMYNVQSKFFKLIKPNTLKGLLE